MKENIDDKDNNIDIDKDKDKINQDFLSGNVGYPMEQSTNDNLKEAAKRAILYLGKQVDDEIVKMLKAFNVQLEKEDKLRLGIIIFLMITLYILTLIPIGTISLLMWFGTIKDPISIIASIVAMPIEIIGVFGIISKSLFADTYRTSLPDMISKYLDTRQKSG
jgi:hypothetical protein